MSGRAVTPKAVLQSSPHIKFIEDHGLYEAYRTVALMAGSGNEFVDLIERHVPENCRIPVGGADNPIREELRKWRLALFGDSDPGRRRYDTDDKRRAAYLVIAETFEGLSLGLWYAGELLKSRERDDVRIDLSSSVHYRNLIRRQKDRMAKNHFPPSWLKATSIGGTPLRIEVGRHVFYGSNRPASQDLAVNLRVPATELTLTRMQDMDWMRAYPKGQFSGFEEYRKIQTMSADMVVRIPGKPFDPFFEEVEPELGWISGLTALIVPEPSLDAFCELLGKELRKVIPIDKVTFS